MIEPTEGVIRWRPPKPTRPPLLPPPPFPPLRPISPPKPPQRLQRYQLREKGSTIGDVQQPEGMEEPPKVKYDPKMLKRMKRDLAELNKKIRRSKKKHDHMIRKRNNLKKAIDDMVRSKTPPQWRPTPLPRPPRVECRELERVFGELIEVIELWEDRELIQSYN